MDDEDDLPVSFDLLLWGTQHPRVLEALSRGKLPAEVKLSSGPLGAVLKIPLSTAPEWMGQLIDRLERAQREGGLELGVLPDRPLSPKQLREQWASALRTRKVAVPLTRAESTVTDSRDWDFSPDFWLY